MKKSILTLIPFAALLALSACSGSTSVRAEDSKGSEESETPVQPFKPVVAPTELLANTRSETFYVGDTYALNFLVTPLMAGDTEIMYASSDPEVASVDENGVITALKQGFATITAQSKLDESVSASVKVSVFDKVNEDSGAAAFKELRSKFSKMKALNKKLDDPTKLKNNQIKSYTLYKDDKLFSKSVQYNNFLFSADDAYVYFGGRDSFQRIEDGTKSRDFGVYQMVTDEDYHSYIYHDGDYNNRYCYVPTEFNLGTKVTRIETIYSILDSLFSSGRDLILNCIEDSMGREWLDRSPTSNMFDAGGYVNETDLMCSYRQNTKGKSTPLMEQNLDIPAGLSYIEDDSFKVYWHEGEVKSFRVQYTLEYVYKNVKHLLVIDESNTFVLNDDVSIKLPDRSKYTEAEDIFDL